MCYHAWPFLSLYIWGLKISLWGGAARSNPWEQQGEGGGREKRKGGKEKRKEGKEMRNGGKWRKKERRKEKKKGEEERKKKEEKEGVLRSEQTWTAKNPELCYKKYVSSYSGYFTPRGRVMAYVFRPIVIVWFVCDCVMVKYQFYGVSGLSET